MENPNKLTCDGLNMGHIFEGNNMSQIVDEQSSALLSTQVSNVYASPLGAKSMSVAALDAAIEHEIRMGTLDPNMDKKHMRRIISNRYAAKKAHDRKVNKMVELENNQKDLENTIAALRPKIEHEQQVKERLRLENAMLVRQLQISTDLNKLKTAQISKHTMEKEWLKGLLGMQQPPSPYNHDVGSSGL